MATPTFFKINFSQIKSESRRSSGDAREKCGSTCRFGVPWVIVTDNGPRFDSTVFQTFCLELNIKNLYLTPCYPQSNGQADATNKTLLNALKKMLEWAKGKWVDELFRVLRAYQTTSRWPIGVTSFALAYGMEVVIPIEIDTSTAKTVV